MIPAKNVKALNLTPEQAEIYKDLERREKLLADALKRCGVYPQAIPGIIAKSDLMRIDANNITALEADINDTWSGLIKKRG